MDAKNLTVETAVPAARLPLQFGERFTYDGARALDIFQRVRSRDESSLELRWREIDAAL
jgi:hypothetical protein